MKFDKFMEICYKILAIFTACIILVASVASCFRPIKVHAVFDEILEHSIKSYLNLYENNRKVVESAFQTDINNGNLDATSDVGKQIISAFALQSLLYVTYGDFYDPIFLENNWENIPDTTTFSASGYTGFYKYQDKIYVGIWTPTDNGTLFSSPLINLTVSCSGSEGHTAPYFNASNSSYNCYGFQRYSTAIYTPFNYTIRDTSGILQEYTYTNDKATGQYFVYFKSANGNSTPNILYGAQIQTYLLSNYYYYITSGNLDISLPSGTVNSKTPWDYYNNILLPFLRQHFPDVPDKYYVFPDGYTPPATPVNPSQPSTDPVEPSSPSNPSLPAVIPVLLPITVAGGLSVYMPVNGTINIDGINIDFDFPDENTITINGQTYTLPLDSLELGDLSISSSEENKLTVNDIPITINADGTVTIGDVNYTLPIGNYSTSPSLPEDIDYDVEIPTLRDIKIPAVNYSAISFSSIPEKVTNGLEFLFASAYELLSASGIITILPVLVVISVVGYSIYRLGGS